MEPVFMVLGQSAGVAAAMAAAENKCVQQVNVRNLQDRLTESGQILSSSAQLERR